MCRRCFPSASARLGTLWIQWLCVGLSSQGDRTQSFKLTQGQHLCVQPLAKFTSSCFFCVIFNCAMCRINIVPFLPCKSKQDILFSPGHRDTGWQGRVKAAWCKQRFLLYFLPFSHMGCLGSALTQHWEGPGGSQSWQSICCPVGFPGAAPPLFQVLISLNLVSLEKFSFKLFF